jgi:hypothetical protein
VALRVLRRPDATATDPLVRQLRSSAAVAVDGRLLRWRRLPRLRWRARPVHHAAAGGGRLGGLLMAGHTHTELARIHAGCPCRHVYRVIGWLVRPFGGVVEVWESLDLTYYGADTMAEYGIRKCPGCLHGYSIKRRDK